MELLQCRSTDTDEDGTHHDGTVDAPIQHPVLIRQGDLEVVKQQQKDEQIVHTEALLDEVPGDELLGRDGTGQREEAGGEDGGAAHPGQGPADGLLVDVIGEGLVEEDGGKAAGRQRRFGRVVVGLAGLDGILAHSEGRRSQTTARSTAPTSC